MSPNLRDVLIGDVPPAAVRDRLYIPLALVAGFVVFLLYKPVDSALWLTGAVPTT